MAGKGQSADFVEYMYQRTTFFSSGGKVQNDIKIGGKVLFEFTRNLITRTQLFL